MPLKSFFQKNLFILFCSLGLFLANSCLSQETETLTIKNQKFELTQHDISYKDYSKNWLDLGINTTIIDEEFYNYLSLHVNHINPKKRLISIDLASNNVGGSFGQFFLHKEGLRIKPIRIMKDETGTIYNPGSRSGNTTLYNSFYADINRQVSYSLGVRGGYNYTKPQIFFWGEDDSRTFQKIHFGIVFAKTLAYKFDVTRNQSFNSRGLSSRNRNVYRTTLILIDYVIREEFIDVTEEVPEFTVFHGPRFELRFRDLGNNPRKNGVWYSLGTSASVNSPLWYVFGGIGKSFSVDG